MAAEHFTTTPEEKAPQTPPAEDITPGREECGAINEEKQTQEEREPSRSSQEDSYWGDDYTEILMGLDQIKAIGDLLVSEIVAGLNSFQKLFPGTSPYDLDNDTLPTLCHLIQEKATRIKYLVEKEL